MPLDLRSRYYVNDSDNRTPSPADQQLPQSPSQHAPDLPDVDASFSLDSLLRTGEASRLRRRRAIRLGHNASSSVAASSSHRQQQPQDHHQQDQLQPLHPLVFNLPRPRALPTMISRASYYPPQMSRSPLRAQHWNPPDSPDAHLITPPYIANAPWAGAWTASAGVAWSDAAPDVDDANGNEDENTNYDSSDLASISVEVLKIREGDEDDQLFVIQCGGSTSSATKPPSSNVQDSGRSSRFQPSVLPLYPAPPPPSSPIASTSSQNGCGAVVHRHVSHRSRQQIWFSTHAAEPFSVAPLDVKYFPPELSVNGIYFLDKSCGCIKEGIACTVCGNPLGTRYTPCSAAAENLFPDSYSTGSVLDHDDHKDDNDNDDQIDNPRTRHTYTFFPSAVTAVPFHPDSTPSPHDFGTISRATSPTVVTPVEPTSHTLPSTSMIFRGRTPPVRRRPLMPLSLPPTLESSTHLRSQPILDRDLTASPVSMNFGDVEEDDDVDGDDAEEQSTTPGRHNSNASLPTNPLNVEDDLIHIMLSSRSSSVDKLE